MAGNAEPAVRGDCAGPHPVPSNPLLAQRPTAPPAQTPATGSHHADKGHPEILPQGSTYWCRISTADSPRAEGARSSLQGLQHLFRALSVSARGATRSVGRSPARSLQGLWGPIGRLIQPWITLHRPGEGMTRAESSRRSNIRTSSRLSRVRLRRPGSGAGPSDRSQVTTTGWSSPEAIDALASATTVRRSRSRNLSAMLWTVECSPGRLG